MHRHFSQSTHVACLASLLLPFSHNPGLYVRQTARRFYDLRIDVHRKRAATVSPVRYTQNIDCENVKARNGAQIIPLSSSVIIGINLFSSFIDIFVV